MIFIEVSFAVLFLNQVVRSFLENINYYNHGDIQHPFQLIFGTNILLVL